LAKMPPVALRLMMLPSPRRPHGGVGRTAESGVQWSGARPLHERESNVFGWLDDVTVAANCPEQCLGGLR